MTAAAAPARLSPAQLAHLWRPSCMDDEEWALWKAANDRIYQKHQVTRPCADCPLGHAADMRAEGRCNGTPGGVEEEDEHMDAGDPADLVTIPEPKVPTRMVRIAVTAPCDGCQHVQVCRITDEVRAIAETSVAVPRVGPSLTLQLSASVSCEFFTPVRKVGRPRRDPDAAPSASAASWTPERRAAQAERARQSNAARSAAKAGEA